MTTGLAGEGSSDGGSRGTTSGSSDPQTPEPDPPTPAPAPSPQRVYPWQRWQPSSKAALIGAAGAVLAALLTGLLALSAGGGVEPRPAPAPRPRVSITSWTETPATPPSKTYVFSGTVTNAPPGMAVHVMVRTSDTDSGGIAFGAEWLVSPKAEILRDGSWKVTWTLAPPPSEGHWVAVLADTHLVAGNTADAYIRLLEQLGPDAMVAVTSTTVTSSPEPPHPPLSGHP